MVKLLFLLFKEDLGVEDAFSRRSAIAQLVGYDGYHDVTRERFSEW
jgi:hypothetical protein